ncbi:MAG: 4-(cytidine 5'-diphospho)-2-C-methyl-D-erythritol kinase [Planctomycetales bacterium]|nr:4-(cytidine 5'-diphospho)-2-C-methyl-D-erythritol kinase [Planctomycetales bacterium]
MYVTSGRTRVKAWAPAKLNLFLEVLGRRDDGFHELDTLMLPIGLWDLLTAEPTDDGSIQLHAEWAMPSGRIDSPLLTDRGIGQLPDAEQNLVYRAFELVRKTHCEPRGVSLGAVVRLWKRIPSEAGMGGGSSDAATALMLANRIWNLHLPFAELAQLAAHLGSDVPFFLYSSSCLCRGRGEIVTPVSSCQSLFFVIVKPPLGLSTAKVFQHTEIPRTPNDSGAIINALSNGTVDQVGKRLFNRLQSAAVSQYESIAQLARVFKRLDVVSHQMTGSGSCYFGLCRNAKHARHLAQTLNSKNLGNAFAVQSARVPISRRLCEQPGQN